MARKEINIITNRVIKAPEKKEIVEDRNFNYSEVEDSLRFFTAENAPNDYQSLKREVKFLAETHARTFVVLAHRLKIIRDREFYKDDGYLDFKEFVENELDIARSTVYNYLSIVEIFPVQDLGQVKTFNLVRALPTIKRYPDRKEEIFNASQSLRNKEFIEYLRKFEIESYRNKDDENLSLDNEWYQSQEELIANSNFLREGMKPKTTTKMIKELVNLKILQEPKNKALQKIKEILPKI